MDERSDGYVRCQRCDTWHRDASQLEVKHGVRVCVDGKECLRTLRHRRDMQPGIPTKAGGAHDEANGRAGR